MIAPGQQTAQQIQWMFWGTSQEAIDRDFYVSLQGMVANYIRAELQTNETIRVGREMHLKVGSYTIHARLTNIVPPLATHFDASTLFVARYREPSKEGQDISAFISEIIRYPDEKYGAIYDSLVGIDSIKKNLERRLMSLLRPDVVERWLQQRFAERLPVTLIQTFRDRYPLIILEGEVGSGKTALARSIGDVVTKKLKEQQVASQVALFVLSAQVRGGGHVGELTQNISRSFDEAEHCYEREQIPIIVLIDEADSLAQMRGSQQTHHEDDAGVNTLIQRIDRLRGRPIAVIFSTNLNRMLDPAILRRASSIFHFDRPTYPQREEVFRALLQSLITNEEAIARLAELTNPRGLPDSVGYHRYTYSDIAQRFVTHALEMAATEGAIREVPSIWKYFEDAGEQILPTPENEPYESLKNLYAFLDPETIKELISSESQQEKSLSYNLTRTEEIGR